MSDDTSVKYARVMEAAEFVTSVAPSRPRLAIVLGSGLGALADQLEGSTVIPYRDVPNFPLSTAPGQPTTHWYQLRCVLSQPLYVLGGQQISGKPNKEENENIRTTSRNQIAQQ